jgi:hypothetical protein
MPVRGARALWPLPPEPHVNRAVIELNLPLDISSATFHKVGSISHTLRVLRRPGVRVSEAGTLNEL